MAVLHLGLVLKLVPSINDPPNLEVDGSKGLLAVGKTPRKSLGVRQSAAEWLQSLETNELQGHKGGEPAGQKILIMPAHP